MGSKRIIYDGACTLCIRSKNTLIALGIADKQEVWAYQEMPDEYLSLVDYDRFRNEMALIDLKGGETMYGSQAVSFLLSSKYLLFRFLFSIGLIYRLFSFVYTIIAFNRTAIMAPALKKVKCASCEPDTPPEYRWFWIGTALGMGLVLSIFMGIFKVQNLSDPYFYLGTGLLFLTFFLILKSYKSNYLEILAHAASLFLMGIVLFNTGILFMELFGGNVPLSIWQALFAGILFVLGKNYLSRAEYLQLSIYEKISGAIILGLILLICYITLIF